MRMLSDKGSTHVQLPAQKHDLHYDASWAVQSSNDVNISGIFVYLFSLYFVCLVFGI